MAKFKVKVGGPKKKPAQAKAGGLFPKGTPAVGGKIQGGKKKVAAKSVLSRITGGGVGKAKPKSVSVVRRLGPLAVGAGAVKKNDLRARLANGPTVTRHGGARAISRRERDLIASWEGAERRQGRLARFAGGRAGPGQGRRADGHVRRLSSGAGRRRNTRSASASSSARWAWGSTPANSKRRRLTSASPLLPRHGQGPAADGRAAGAEEEDPRRQGSV